MMREPLLFVFQRTERVARGRGLVARAGIALDDKQSEQRKALLYMALLTTNNGPYN